MSTRMPWSVVNLNVPLISKVDPFSTSPGTIDRLRISHRLEDLRARWLVVMDAMVFGVGIVAKIPHYLRILNQRPICLSACDLNIRIGDFQCVVAPAMIHIAMSIDHHVDIMGIQSDTSEVRKYDLVGVVRATRVHENATPLSG